MPCNDEELELANELDGLVGCPDPTSTKIGSLSCSVSESLLEEDMVLMVTRTNRIQANNIGRMR